MNTVCCSLYCISITVGSLTSLILPTKYLIVSSLVLCYYANVVCVYAIIFVCVVSHIVIGHGHVLADESVI